MCLFALLQTLACLADQITTYGSNTSKAKGHVISQLYYFLGFKITLEKPRCYYVRVSANVSSFELLFIWFWEDDTQASPAKLALRDHYVLYLLLYPSAGEDVRTSALEHAALASVFQHHVIYLAICIFRTLLQGSCFKTNQETKFSTN